MLDHVFVDAIGALRDALEGALLERMSPEEHFQVDVITGDTTWETSYGLPGEGIPPRVRADITLDWPTWSQSAFRSWMRSEEFIDEPRIEVGIVIRLQRLVDLPDPAAIIAHIADGASAVGPIDIRPSAPTVELIYDDDLRARWHALELAFEGGHELDERALSDGAILDKDFAAMGGWIAATLVRLGDLPLEYHDG